MDNQDLIDFADHFFSRCLKTMEKKNADYTPGSDPFGNFTSVERFGIQTETGFITRMVDKMSRISSFVNKGDLMVKDETVQDTLLDLANYACLMAAYIESKKPDDADAPGLA